MQEINRSLRDSLKPILQMRIPKINVDIPVVVELRKSLDSFHKNISPQFSEIGRRAKEIQDNMYPTLSHLREITENNTLSISNSINNNSSREDVEI